jgi:uncharacterized protein (TIGR02246 family)
MRFILFVTLIVCLVFAFCAPPPEPQHEAEEAPSTEADVEAIKSVNVALINALNSSDASAAVALVTDNAVDLPPNRPAVIGKEAIRSFVQSDFDRVTMNFNEEIVEVEVDGDLAVIWTNYTVTLTPKDGGEPIENKGKWLKVLKRLPDGSWKFSRNIWNSDNPPPEGPA